MERRVFPRSTSLATLVAGLAGVSCGTGVYDGDGEQATMKLVSTSGDAIAFMGAKLEICPGCLKPDRPVAIKVTWQRAIEHTGALSSVYSVEVPAPDTFQNDPKITISTTQAIAGNPDNVIGFMVPGIGQWIPDQPPAPPVCEQSDQVCGPVQIQGFTNPYGDHLGQTTTLRFAIVTKCGPDTKCPSGQTCNSGACQQCPTLSCQ
jgi:hypothetical protein